MLEKIGRIIEIEKKRYAKKGLKNIAIAIFLILTIFYSALQVGTRYWPSQIDNKLHFVFVGSFICHFGFKCIIFLFHLPAYMGWTTAYAPNLINKKASLLWNRKNWY